MMFTSSIRGRLVFFLVLLGMPIAAAAQALCDGLAGVQRGQCKAGAQIVCTASAAGSQQCKEIESVFMQTSDIPATWAAPIYPIQCVVVSDWSGSAGPRVR